MRTQKRQALHVQPETGTKPDRTLVNRECGMCSLKPVSRCYLVKKRKKKVG